MSDGHARLVHMANQIARNLAVAGEGAAAEATADHIASFWDPRMKAGILADRAGLDPIAAAAIDLLARRGAPLPQTRATRFGEAAGVDRSDAG